MQPNHQRTRANIASSEKICFGRQVWASYLKYQGNYRCFAEWMNVLGLQLKNYKNDSNVWQANINDIHIFQQYCVHEKDWMIRFQKNSKAVKKKLGAIASPTINNSDRNSKQKFTEFYDIWDHISVWEPHFNILLFICFHTSFNLHLNLATLRSMAE